MGLFLPGVFFGDLDGVESLGCVGPTLSATSFGMFSLKTSSSNSSAPLFLFGFENRLTGVEWRKQKNLLARKGMNGFRLTLKSKIDKIKHHLKMIKLNICRLLLNIFLNFENDILGPIIFG